MRRELPGPKGPAVYRIVPSAQRFIVQRRIWRTTYVQENSRSVSVAALAVAEPAAVSAADTRNVSVQLAKCNPCASKRGCNHWPREEGLQPLRCQEVRLVRRKANNLTRQETLVHLHRRFSLAKTCRAISKQRYFEIAEDAYSRASNAQMDAPCLWSSSAFFCDLRLRRERGCALRRQHSFRGHDGIGDHLATADGRAGLRADIFRTYLRRDLFRHPSGRGGRSHRHRAYSD